MQRAVFLLAVAVTVALNGNFAGGASMWDIMKTVPSVRWSTVKKRNGTGETPEEVSDDSLCMSPQDGRRNPAGSLRPSG
ncbi:hypothetical protein ElyMa_001009700 [Elysia marginata]|uniref:Uncharacterized protein n=1 Tax=Elysia marginata TaxID=1093978 RepID=A0AAV4HL41_9GAST|nr:hypothetical protein ElyMa_001009700 [Elysia marginata]